MEDDFITVLPLHAVAIRVGLEILKIEELHVHTICDQNAGYGENKQGADGLCACIHESAHNALGHSAVVGGGPPEVDVCAAPTTRGEELSYDVTLMH